MLQGLLVLWAIVVPTRSFPEERELLNRRLETLRRILPDGPTLNADTAHVKELANAAHLAGVDALARPPFETGNRGDVIVDVSGQGRLPEIDRFFRSVSLSHRLIDVESLSLQATPESAVRLSAVMHIPFRPGKAPLPAPPEGTRARVAGIPRPQADAYIRDASLALAKSEQIVALRRARRNPRLFLSELAAIVRDRPVVLTGVTLGDEFLVRGITVGEGPARALESRFERGFFRISEFLMARHGACRQFEVRGRTPVAGPDAELPLPAEDPFAQGEAACRTDRDTGRNILVKAEAKKGPYTLRARDVDLPDVFQMLNRLTGAGFVVDGNVEGRVSIDLPRTTIEEAFAAILKASDLRAVDFGSVRRISIGKAPKPSPAPSPSPSPGKPGMTFSVKRADVRDILAVMTEADPSEATLGPTGTLGRVSVFAKDAALRDVRAAVLESGGLIEHEEEGHKTLERHPGSGEALAPVSGTPPDPRLVFSPQDLSVSEFELSGLVSDSERWIAFSYAPSGRLNPYRPGERLADGVVREIESTDILLDAEDGALRVSLPPLP